MMTVVVTPSSVLAPLRSSKHAKFGRGKQRKKKSKGKLKAKVNNEVLFDQATYGKMINPSILSERLRALPPSSKHANFGRGMQKKLRCNLHFQLLWLIGQPPPWPLPRPPTQHDDSGLAATVTMVAAPSLVLMSTRRSRS